MRQGFNKITIALFYTGWIILFSVQSLLAQTVTAPVPVDFNELKLREKVAARIASGNLSKNPAYSAFNSDKVIIEKRLQFNFQNQTFFGVRLKILPVVAEQKHEFLYLIVDRDINYQFSDVIRIEDGVSEFSPVMMELRRIELPEAGLGHEIEKGNGVHHITLVSDPFCPYCRKVWDYLYQNRASFKSFKLAHYPLHPPSRIASAVMMYAQKKQLDILAIANFSYTRLISSESPIDILYQYVSEFPVLKKHWGENLEKAAEMLQTDYSQMVAKEHEDIRDLGISGTPATFVDGYMVEGFNATKFNELIK